MYAYIYLYLYLYLSLCVNPQGLTRSSSPSRATRNLLPRTPNLTWGIQIQLFLWRSHKNPNRVFRLVCPVYGMNTTHSRLI